MKTELKTIKVYEQDRNKLENIKRKKKKKSIADATKSVLDLIKKHKMEDEIE